MTLSRLGAAVVAVAFRQFRVAATLLVAVLLPALATVEARLAAGGQLELAAATDTGLVALAVTLVILLISLAGDLLSRLRGLARRPRPGGVPGSRQGVGADVQDTRSSS